MNGETSGTLTRDELYELVWSHPMSQLSRRYAISDVGLAKVRKRHAVPYPPRGYWAKVRNGKSVRKPPLLKIDDPSLQNVRLGNKPIPSRDVDSPTREKPRREPVPVPDTLDHPHPLVERTLKHLSRSRPNEEGLVAPKVERCLAVQVAPDSVDRAARLLDALVKAAEARGFKIAPGDEGSPRTWISIAEERFSLTLTETIERRERLESFFHSIRKYDRVPTGRLVFRVEGGPTSGQRRQWADGQKRLETRLGSILAGVANAAEASRLWREENDRREKRRQEEERRRREAERAKREEEARVVDFDRKQARWEQAERIRSFAAAVRRNAELQNGPIPPHGELQRSLDWALARADRLDPLNADRDDRWPPPTGMVVWIDGRENGSWPYGGGYGGTPIAPPPLSAEADPEGVRSTVPADDDRNA